MEECAMMPSTDNNEKPLENNEDNCPECGNVILHQGGCTYCPICGYSPKCY